MIGLRPPDSTTSCSSMPLVHAQRSGSFGVFAIWITVSAVRTGHARDRAPALVARPHAADRRQRALRDERRGARREEPAKRGAYRRTGDITREHRAIAIDIRRRDIEQVAKQLGRQPRQRRDIAERTRELGASAADRIAQPARRRARRAHA